MMSCMAELMAMIAAELVLLCIAELGTNRHMLQFLFSSFLSLTKLEFWSLVFQLKILRMTSAI